MHTTTFLIHEPCDPEMVFGRFRRACGVPDSARTSIHAAGDESNRKNYEDVNVTRVSSGSKDVWLSMDICPSGQVECCCKQHWLDGEEIPTDDPELCFKRKHFYLRITLDTSYWSMDRLGCPQCLHVKIARQAIGDLGVFVSFSDETTGQIFMSLDYGCEHDLLARA